MMRQEILKLRPKADRYPAIYCTEPKDIKDTCKNTKTKPDVAKKKRYMCVFHTRLSSTFTDTIKSGRSNCIVTCLESCLVVIVCVTRDAPSATEQQAYVCSLSHNGHT